MDNTTHDRKITYKDAGVDLQVYQEAMSRLPRLLARTHSPLVASRPNGFAGLFRLDFAGPLFAHRYREPLLVACTDGVGTKLKVAQLAGRHGTVGVDLVAMCVNDALTSGAQPLFFLDYVAMAEDDPPLLEQLVAGISQGCVDCGAALLGGETAIMPDLYRAGEYDLAGFCVGIVEKSQLIDGSAIAPGDVALGLASSGIHSNGYSLVRKIVFEHAGLTLDECVPGDGRSVGDVLLEPTRIYVAVVHELLRKLAPPTSAGDPPHRPPLVRGIAHVTGGGLHENLQRIVPPGVDVEIDRHSWTIPQVFPWLQSLGDVDDDEMHRVFNMGIGLVLVVPPEIAAEVQQCLAAQRQPSWLIGRAVAGSGQVRWASPANVS